jgi:hypothetical protein
MWEIINSNQYRWGTETYPTREAAEQELKSFWKGVSGVDLKKFTIREVAWQARPHEDEADDILAEIAEEFEAWRDSTPDVEDPE